MKTGFYPKLALNGIRKNGRLYTPYILTCAGMVMMFYIMMYLSTSDYLKGIRGGQSLTMILTLGSFVLAIFALIFLFYTNSFLVRRRNREFGLYNILGMGKRNIAHIMLWETLIVAADSLIGGTVAGIALSKLAELILVRVIGGAVTYDLSVSLPSIIMTLLLFLAIYFLILLNSLRQVHFSSAIALLHSENSGEKPPKGNFLLGAVGIAILGGAYYIAVTIANPLAALAKFFIAVIMVIVATYLLFIFGSVLFCRILQKNKAYYYKPNHFVSISSMVYRMKRNGAGLASICILATMVLVMISSTTCMYFGAEDSLRARYPRQINLTMTFEDYASANADAIADLRQNINETAGRADTGVQNQLDYRAAVTYGLLKDGVLDPDAAGYFASSINYNNMAQVYIIPLDDYNRQTGSNETLSEDEVLIYSDRIVYKNPTITIKNSQTFTVKKQLTSLFDNGSASANIISSLFIIVPDIETIEPILELSNSYGKLVDIYWFYSFDTTLGDDAQIQLTADISHDFADNYNPSGVRYFSTESIADNRADFYSMYAGLFFLGIMLSIVFIAAAVLIIYYKQISEGYEDQSRFDIMRKVGMTKKEIKKSINSQLLTVFYLPLIFAGLHLSFAFPFINKLLMLFNLFNVPLLIGTTVISFAAFALFYMIVYKVTSNSYYTIVSSAKNA